MTKQGMMSYREEMRRIMRTEGLKGFRRGWLAMNIRDGPTYGIYFYCFGIYKRVLQVDEIQKDPKHSNLDLAWRQFLSGGTAGCTSWFLMYPMDVIKTKIQSYPGKGNPSFTRIVRELY